METHDPVFFESRKAFREWLEKNHDRADELWVGFYNKASGRPTVGYVEAVEEALCFGWIDGLRHKHDAESFMNRFTPRRKGSNWSAINLKRVEALIEQGLMHPAGLREFEARESTPSPGYTYETRPQELPEPYLSQLKASTEAWRFYSSQPPGYRRTTAWWVVEAKREETRQKRLQTLIAAAEAGKRIGL